MKRYSVLSKIILAACVCGIVATIINHFTGFINATLQKNGGGSAICIMGFIVAGAGIIIMEQERMKKSKY